MVGSKARLFLFVILGITMFFSCTFVSPFQGLAAFVAGVFLVGWGVSRYWKAMNRGDQQAPATKGSPQQPRLLAIPIKPDDHVAWNDQGIVLSKAGDNQGAIDAFRKVIEIKPTFSFAWGNLGEVLRETGQDQAAIEAFRKAVAIDPGSPCCWSRLGLLLWNKGDKQGAIDASRQATIVAPNDADAWASLGACLGDTGDKQGAANAYHKAISLDPGNLTILLAFAFESANAGDYRSAIPFYRKAMRNLPDHAPGWNALGLALQEAGDIHGALVACRRAWKIDPTNNMFRNSYVYLLYLENGRNKRILQEALDIITPATTNSQDMNVLDTHACILSALERYEEAKQQFLASISLREKDNRMAELTWKEFQVTLNALGDDATLQKYDQYFKK
jgi:Flp pilus assembly protein TadD